MPIIAKFYGLVIKMYFRQSEHNLPHFHAFYGDYVGVFTVTTVKMKRGIIHVSPNKRSHSYN